MSAPRSFWKWSNPCFQCRSQLQNGASSPLIVFNCSFTGFQMYSSAVVPTDVLKREYQIEASKMSGPWKNLTCVNVFSRHGYTHCEQIHASGLCLALRQNLDSRKTVDNYSTTTTIMSGMMMNLKTRLVWRVRAMHRIEIRTKIKIPQVRISKSKSLLRAFSRLNS